MLRVFILAISMLAIFYASASEPGVEQQAIDSKFENGDLLASKFIDIQAALLNYHEANSVWPANITALATDGYYGGNYTNPFGGEITGSVNGLLYNLNATTIDEASAAYVAGLIDGSNTTTVVTLSVGIPGASAIADTLLSRVNTGDVADNTMGANLYMGNFDILDVGDIQAYTLHATAGVYDGGVRVYSSINKPTAAELSVVPETRTVNGKALTNNITLTASDVGAVPVTRTINGYALSGDISLSKSDIGLSNVGNYGISDSYTLNSSTTYASSKAVRDAYVTLDAAKLDAGAKAANTALFEGLAVSNFVLITRKINGKALSSDITLAASDVGAGGLNTANQWTQLQTFNGGVLYNGNSATDFPIFNVTDGTNQAIETYKNAGATFGQKVISPSGDYVDYVGVELRNNGNKVFHSGNDGAGSGLDADTVDGYNTSMASNANTIAVRNGSGDINARLFRSEYDTTNANIGFIMTQVDTASNNYIRPSTPAQFRAAVTDAYYLGKTAKANDSDKLDNLDSTAFMRANANDDVTGHTEWQDNYEVRLGSGADFRMMHNGSHTYLTNYTNDLYIRNQAPGREIYIQADNSSSTAYNAISVIADTNVRPRLYYNGATKLETTNSGISVTGKVFSDTGWQSDYMNAFHSGNSFFMRPYDDGAWQSGREFGYDAGNNRWFVEGDMSVSGTVVANDVSAGGTSMSEIKTFMDSAQGGQTALEKLSAANYETFQFVTTYGGYATTTVLGNYFGEGILSRVEARYCDYVKVSIDSRQFVANTVNEVLNMFYINSIFGGKTSSYYTGGNFLFREQLRVEVRGTDPSCVVIVDGVRKA